MPRDFDGAAAAFPALYRQYRPDGVLCANDTIAAAVLSAARGLGLSVPATLAVAGHNNSIVAKCAYPSLTSVDNGVDVLSRTTAENVVALFSGRPVPAPSAPTSPSSAGKAFSAAGHTFRPRLFSP